MTTSDPDPRHWDRAGVRLAWPARGGDEPPRAEPAEPVDDWPPATPTDASPGVARGEAEVGRPSFDAPMVAVPVAGAGVDASGALRRAIVETYDRFADRVLNRLRSIEQGVDADLAEVRSELSDLRKAVEDVSERVQLRQLRSSVDDLRSDVAGLRRAVLEWPELERVSSDIAALRADLSDLVGRQPEAPGESGDAPGSVVAALGPVVEEVAGLRSEVAESAGQLAEELGTVRADLNALRRRFPLRAGPPEVQLSEEQLSDLADRVAEHLIIALEPGNPS